MRNSRPTNLQDSGRLQTEADEWRNGKGEGREERELRCGLTNLTILENKRKRAGEGGEEGRL